MKPNMFDDTDVPTRWQRVSTIAGLVVPLLALLGCAAYGLWCLVSH